MLLSQKELSHLVFLADVVLNGKKKAAMEDTLRCLLYVVKSLPEAELPDSVVEHIRLLVENIEAQLRSENNRQQEIELRFAQRGQRNPLG
ncbi:hypothetical protein [Paenibacillus sp. J2TS4]|uniref:hypothetical protein n=1 Tax=Paenibacillus sp. J2TS4 TaxID=2807194 RepID=UPI001B2D0E06|nr:hypothetical protein [Paenibacillus sp. J2TS4]GIP33930.1 hypothetical protein J2TS4_31400 [Paenibacillus sp. J2TS4]